MLKVRLHVFRMQVQGFTGVMHHARGIPAGTAQDQRLAVSAQVQDLDLALAKQLSR